MPATLIGIFIFTMLPRPEVVRLAEHENKSQHSSLVQVMAEVAATQPGVGVNTTCRPRKLPRYRDTLIVKISFLFRFPNCSNIPGLTGEILLKPRKLVLMLLFSFEVDTLEISLREQQEMVDKIFIVESSSSHKGVTNLIRWVTPRKNLTNG